MSCTSITVYYTLCIFMYVLYMHVISYSSPKDGCIIVSRGVTSEATATTARGILALIWSSMYDLRHVATERIIFFRLTSRYASIGRKPEYRGRLLAIGRNTDTNPDSYFFLFFSPVVRSDGSLPERGGRGGGAGRSDWKSCISVHRF